MPATSLPPKTTLRRVLTQAKPQPIVTGKLRSRNVTGAYPELTTELPGGDLPDGDLYFIYEWDEFDMDTLNKSYGHILDEKIHDNLIPVPNALDAQGETIEINNAKDIDNLIRWNATALKEALPWARDRVGLSSNHGFHQRYQETHQRKRFRIPGQSDPGTGWVDHLISLDVHPWKHLVVGIGKPTNKFDGRELINKPWQSGDAWALRYLAQQCKLAGTRYGYIMSERDLTVCCFSVMQGNTWSVSIMPIPWNTYGEEELTTDLALLWLTLLALSGDHNRAIIPRHDVVEIDEWRADGTDGDGRKMSKHQYSGRRLPTDSVRPVA